jgi:proteasome lid subunit RPN8/RPN11
MIELRHADLELIRAAAVGAYPNECCGLLIGRHEGGRIVVSRVVPAANVAGERARDRFEIDPKVRIDTERSLRGTEDAVVGHYHSHPDHPAAPSATDASMVYEPALIWVIASIQRGMAGPVRAWRFEDGHFKEVELVA